MVGNSLVEVSMPPAIMKSAASGKTYIVAGKWVEVPEGTTLADADKYVKYVRPHVTTKTWKVTSTSGNQYTIRRFGENRYTCDCPGFKFYKKCKHIKNLVESSQ